MRTEQSKNNYQAVIASLLVVAMTTTIGCGPATYDPADEEALGELSSEVRAQTLTLEVTSPSGERTVEKAKLNELLSAAEEAAQAKSFKPATVLSAPTTKVGSTVITNQDGKLQSTTAEDSLALSWNLDRGEVVFHTHEGPTKLTIKGTSDRRVIANAIGALAALTFHAFDKAATGELQSEPSTQGWFAVVVVIVASCLIAKGVCAGIAYLKCKTRGGVASFSASCGGFPPKLTCRFTCRR